MIRVLKIALPVVALLVAVVVSYVLFLTRPKVQHQAVDAQVPLVTVSSAKARAMNIPVYTRGTISPGTQIQLVSEVSGQVLEVSPHFANGGFFQKGEVLVRVDTLEYDVNIKRAEAAVAQAYQAYLQAQAERKARSRSSGSNQLATFEVQYKQAEAHYQAAKAELEAVKLQRERTTVRAPFDGRVLMAVVNVGQYLRPGLQMGVIYAVDVAEVRLPLSDRQLSLVDVPGRMNTGDTSSLPEVIFSEEYAGKTYTWKGHVVRSEGGVDERNRLLYLVAEVPDPYGVDPEQPGRPELVSGSFVEAKIAGRRFERVFAVPRRALRNGSQVWVVGDDGRLDKRDIGVLYKGKDTIYVTTGIDDGDQVVLSQLDIAVEGMRVRAQQEGTHDEFEESADDNNPFAGRTPVDPAIRDVVTATPRGATLNIPPEKAKELASKAKEFMDDMTPEQKQQVKDSASKIAEQIRTMQRNLAPAQNREPAKAPAKSPESTSRTSEKPTEEAAPVAEAAVDPTPEQPAQSSQPAMSHLASQLEADIAAQQQADEAPQKQLDNAATQEPEQPVAVGQPEPEAPASKRELLANSDKGSRSYVISTAVAPKPLMEASR